LGGLPNIVIATPEIISFNLTENHDYIIMGCDGVFDNLTNKEIFEGVVATFESETPVTIYNNNKPTFSSKYKSDDLHSQMGLITDSIIKSCFKSLSSDNISLILICFESFRRLYETQDLKKVALKMKQLTNENIMFYKKFEEDQNNLKMKSSKGFKRSLSTQSTSSKKLKHV
jgi:hypothetical protein